MKRNELIAGKRPHGKSDLFSTEYGSDGAIMFASEACNLQGLCDEIKGNFLPDISMKVACL